MFSSALLGRAYEQLISSRKLGTEVSMAALSDFSAEEMSHIASFVQRTEGPVSEKAMSDCIRIIREEHQSGSAESDDDILSLQKQMMARKGLKT